MRNTHTPHVQTLQVHTELIIESISRKGKKNGIMSESLDDEQMTSYVNIFVGA